MKHLLSILCLFIFSCDSGGDSDNSITYIERYMLLADGVFDTEQLKSIGTTDHNGHLSYSNKASFPTLYNFPNMERRNEFGDVLANFNILDFTTGNVSFLISHNGSIYQTPVFEIKDKINIINIELSTNSIEFVEEYQSGEFNLIININGDLFNPSLTADIKCQYELNCNSDIFTCLEGPMNRPTTSITYSIPESSYFNFQINLLDNTSVIDFNQYLNSGEYQYPIICSNIEDIEGCLNNNEFCQWNDTCELNYEHDFFNLDTHSVSGIQVFKYSLEILDSYQRDYIEIDEGNIPSNFNLNQNYPNPFN